MTIDIVSWHPILTDHQAYTLLALKDAENANVTVNVTKTEDVIRKAQGWTETNLPSLNMQILPKYTWLMFIIHQLRVRKNSIHLFNSPFEQPKLILALFLALMIGRKVYLVSEPYSPIAIGYLKEGKGIINKLKSRLRPFIYSFYGVFLKRRLEGVFAISPLAVSQYKSIGIEDINIYPFGYFVPKISMASDKSFSTKSVCLKCRVVFIGNLITRKGLNLLIDAAKKIYDAGTDFHIDVYGHGDSNSFEFNDAYITYKGKIPFGRAQAVIANYDLLVLPSLYDGWGVVVNEAVLAGVPVICSESVGAAAVIKNWDCGISYQNNAVNSLLDSLLLVINDSNRRNKMAKNAINNRDALTPLVAGKYMGEVFRAKQLGLPKPANPWY